METIMTENDLNIRLRRKLEILLPGYIIMKHSDRAQSGWPDFSVVGRGMCSQWEVKLADPDFESPGIQELTCQRLAVAGYCRYIIFDFRITESPCTSIVHPVNIKDWKLERERFSVGLAFNMIAEAIRDAHMAMPYIPR
jgi:hypothetical protein